MRTRTLIMAAGSLSASLLLVVPGVATAGPKPKPQPKITSSAVVMPFNLDVGRHSVLVADGGQNLVGRLKSDGTIATIAADQPGASGVARSRDGKRIGSNVVRALRGGSPRPFTFPGLGQGASLGVGRGAAELYGVQLTGWPAWLARWFFFHWFMPSRAVAARTALEWFTGAGQSHQNIQLGEPAISSPYALDSSLP